MSVLQKTGNRFKFMGLANNPELHHQVASIFHVLDKCMRTLCLQRILRTAKNLPSSLCIFTFQSFQRCIPGLVSCRLKLMTIMSYYCLKLIKYLTVGYQLGDNGVPLEGIVRPAYIQLPDSEAKVVKVAAGKIIQKYLSNLLKN